MTTPFTLNLASGAVSFPLSVSEAQRLQTALYEFVQSLKTIAAQVGQGEKPSPQPDLNYQSVGEVLLEIFCNPNIYPNPHSAKVLITVRDEKIRISVDVELSRLLEDLNTLLN